MNFKYYILIFNLLFITNSQAQTEYQFGFLPSISLNNKLKNNWSANFKVESRQRIKKRIIEDGAKNDYDYLFTDFSFITRKKVGLNTYISTGYQIRAQNKYMIHRLIQQYIWTHKLAHLKLAHRFVSDQTFSKSQQPIFRFRYRITPKFPLKGKQIDVKEFYLKMGNEYVNSLQSKNYDLEIRLLPYIGYTISPDSKIEAGLDYRIKSFLNSSPFHSYWMGLNWSLSI